MTVCLSPAIWAALLIRDPWSSGSPRRSTSREQPLLRPRQPQRQHAERVGVGGEVEGERGEEGNGGEGEEQKSQEDRVLCLAAQGKLGQKSLLKPQ